MEGRLAVIAGGLGEKSAANAEEECGEGDFGEAGHGGKVVQRTVVVEDLPLSFTACSPRIC